MRIRNRKVPLPLSSLSPVPLSDPPFSDLLPLHSNPPPNLSPQDARPSHKRNCYTADGSSCRNSSDYPSKQAQHEFLRKEGRDPKGEEEEGEKSRNHNRKETIWGAKTPIITAVHQGEEVFPLKKRRGSIERRKTDGETITKEINGNKSGARKKMRVRGGALMEGSRCSRVNGRGWRCCQPTLVGYSLCEHHLGKGRLRSMTTVRSKSTATPNKVESRPLSLEGEQEMKGTPLKEDEMQPLLMSRRKQKLGMVKARSMSSLLGQPNNATISIAENEELYR